MKEFFDNYGKIIGKNILNHIAMAIFGVLVGMTTALINNVLFYVAGVLAILMYMFLIYIVMWEVGSQDKIKVDGGRMKKNKLVGLNIALISNSLLILLGVLVAILSATVPEGAEPTAYTSFVGLLETANYFSMSMYMQIFSLAPNFNAMYILMVIPGILCGTLSYLAGLSGMKCIVPDNKKNQKK